MQYHISNLRKDTVENGNRQIAFRIFHVVHTAIAVGKRSNNSAKKRGANFSPRAPATRHAHWAMGSAVKRSVEPMM